MTTRKLVERLERVLKNITKASNNITSQQSALLTFSLVVEAGAELSKIIKEIKDDNPVVFGDLEKVMKELNEKYRG